MAECSGGIERAHIHHRGMGGKDVGWYRNTIPLCGAHHRGGKGEHRLGPTTFDATYNTDRQVEADRIGDLVDTKISAGA